MKYIIAENYNALDRLKNWDEETQKTIRKRILEGKKGKAVFSFLGIDKGRILKALVDLLIPQPAGDSYIEIAEIIDRSLTHKKEGVRYADDPWRGEFYEQSLTIIQDMVASGGNLEQIINSALEEKGQDPLKRFSGLVLRDAVFVYYSHPSAWSEIGFPGPSYPEGYFMLACGESDSWEPQYHKLDHEA